MKTILLILVLVLTQAAAAQEAGINRAPALSTKATEAYGIKAESKLREFYDYVSLLTDPAINAEMKAQAFKEALKLYQNEHVDTDNLFSPRGEEVTIYKLLKNATQAYGKCTYHIREFDAQLQANTASQQVWLLTYDLHTGTGSWQKIRHNYYVVHEEKQFGKTTKKVWNAYLGEIDIREWHARPRE